jgi:hypothetical protein
MGAPPQYGQPSLAGLTSSGVNPFEGLAAQPFMGPGGHAGGDGVADGAGSLSLAPVPTLTLRCARRCIAVHVLLRVHAQQSGSKQLPQTDGFKTGDVSCREASTLCRLERWHGRHRLPARCLATGAAASAAFQASFPAGGGSLGPWGNLGPEPSGGFAFNPLMSLNTLMKIGSMGSLGSLPQQPSEFHGAPAGNIAAHDDADAGNP